MQRSLDFLAGQACALKPHTARVWGAAAYGPRQTQCRGEIPHAEDTATFFGHLSALFKLSFLLGPPAHPFLKRFSRYANPSTAAQMLQNKAHPSLVILHLQTRGYEKCLPQAFLETEI